MKYIITALLIVCCASAFAQTDTIGLVAYYPFNGDVLDHSGNGNNGVVHGSITFVSNPFGSHDSSAHFDSSSWIEVLPAASLTPSYNFSIFMRFLTTASTPQIPISKSTDTGYYNPYASITSPKYYQYLIGLDQPLYAPDNDTKLYFTTNQSGVCDFDPTGLDQEDITFGDTIATNKWYCLLVTFDSGVKNIYIDGTLVGSDTVHGFTVNDHIDSCGTGILKIGTWWQEDPQFFQGNIDEIKIYNRTLTATEIATACNDTVITNAVQNVTQAQDAPAMYPNPAYDRITITISQPVHDATVTIYDILGKEIKTVAIKGNDQIDVSHFAAGVYVAKICYNNQVVIRKFLKQ